MSITWNGVSSDTIGVIVERIPNRYVPTRRFSPQQVAGRNGNILLVDKAFPNVEQEYEVYLSAEVQGLPSVARACAEWLMGPDGYCRLEDSYDTTVYREAFLMGGYDLENILNKFGRCTITFSCKPQKYLLTGDTPIEIPAGITTYTGDVVQFDGVTGASITSLSTTITPTQDLHGYDSPWPAGGMGNLLPQAQAEDVIGDTTGLSITFSDDGIITLDGTNVNDNVLIRVPIPNQLPVAEYTACLFNSVALTIGQCQFSLRNIRTSPAGGWYAPTGVNKSNTFTSEQDAYWWQLQINKDALFNNVKLYPMLVAGSTPPTTYYPYSNICPISGRTGVSVYRTGINVWDEQWEVGTLAWANGSNAFANDRIRSKNYIPCVPNTTYYFKTPKALNVFYYDASKTFIKYEPSPVANGTKTTPDNAYFIRFFMSTAYGTTYNNDISINYPSTDHDYHAYNGTTYAIDWTSEAGTVYGGTLDVVTGVLTVTHKKISLGDYNYGKSSDNNFYISTVTDFKAYGTGTTRYGLALCDSFAFLTGNWASHNSTCTCYYNAGYNGYRIFFHSEEHANDSIAQFKAYMQSIGASFVYELATPLTYQLTPQEIEVLVGKNNVWTSSGPVSVTVEAPFAGIVTNPTPFEARPMLEVSGVGEITINGKTIQILESVSDFDIDCESMEAEGNSKIYCMDFPELSGGENEIVGDGSITALTVTPRWWTL